MAAVAATIRVLIFLYARISEDPLDQKRGVKRQLADLYVFAEELGGEVTGEWTDNDLSAHSGEERPGYDQMMEAALAAGRQPGVRVIVAAYHPSRLWRRRVERAQAIEDLRRIKAIVTFESGGRFNMAKATDRSQLANLGEADTAESEVKSERVQRAALERAQEGRANGPVAYGWQRQYEHDARGKVIGFHDYEHPDQAAIVREIVKRLLAGDTLLGVTADLNRRGVPAPGAGQNRKHRTLGQDETGTRWNKTSTKKIALRPANIAIRVHRTDDGETEYPAAWPALITAEQHAQVKNLFADRARSGEKPGARKHMLSWGEIAVCGVCSGHLRVALRGNAKRGKKVPLYVCDSNSGCVGRNEAALDKHVSDIAVKLLQRPEATDVFRGDDSAALAALERAEGLKARQDAAADDYAAGLITRDQLVRITSQLARQITEAHAEARRLRPAFDLAAFDGLVGPKAPEKWEALTVAQKRRVLVGLGLRLRILPAVRHGPGFDASTIKMKWTGLAG
jgi:DNA invertase Pin-like site-specific DNA recombinase